MRHRQRLQRWQWSRFAEISRGVRITAILQGLPTDCMGAPLEFEIESASPRSIALRIVAFGHFEGDLSVCPHLAGLSRFVD
jgi:hypothetical protein